MIISDLFQSSRQSKHNAIMLHHLPKGDKLWAVWMNRIRHNNWPSGFGHNLQLCSAYFTAADFE